MYTVYFYTNIIYYTKSRKNMQAEVQTFYQRNFE